MTDQSASAPSPGVPWQKLFVAATVLVVIYLAFALAAFLRADDAGVSELLWSRSVYVLLGVEAIAFTAVGWLFGREVHRGEALAAKEQAQDAKEEAKESREDAKQAAQKADAAKDDRAAAAERASVAEVKGRALADAIRAQDESSDGGNESDPGDGGGAGVPGPLRSLADSLFPPN